MMEGVSTINEGCLSLPGATLEISRPSAVKLRALDYYGAPFEIVCRGLSSACVQHETDHLDGVLIFDRADPTERRRAIQNVWDAEHPSH
jgi:peptide deformylase